MAQIQRVDDPDRETVHCRVIHCLSIGVINALYLGHLIRILEHINSNKHALRRIVLCGENYIKLTDSEFSKYKALMMDKVQWVLEQTTSSIVTVSRTRDESDDLTDDLP